ncbi:hypothetical protein [Polymorphobacter fuscus]|uniref:Uncharacterized protein n=1 Tax=Sandarakinorhabdus fusca TaxID=1439888 RepID=A0A7C9GQF3_9SPHN|nr:hypothetical protein [Polymorphobacter fuscus]KAB7644358.1 hypothetical protein F9290_13525 [Polymorphobacter fuscus]MQT18275.1 hypothetical protein [Polymorphobacter fuscus]NJC08169.1 hypothetical protein [Polymorphobacter fuscus]
MLSLQPLRIPGGWIIEWNTLYETSRAERGDFGGSSVFRAVNERQRFSVDVEFRPEFDPDGKFHLVVVYQPWPRTERGRRRTNLPFLFDGSAETVHDAEMPDYATMIAELERWLARCSGWMREGN